MKSKSISRFLAQISISEIDQVTFFKRDEITTDLICCELRIGDKTWLFHEEEESWGDLLERLGQLEGFKTDWRQDVVHPSFESNPTVAFDRAC
jgi:hypothetical protein